MVQNLPRVFSSPTGCHEVFFINDHVNTVGYKNTEMKIGNDLSNKTTVRNPRIRFSTVVKSINYDIWIDRASDSAIWLALRCFPMRSNERYTRESLIAAARASSVQFGELPGRVLFMRLSARVI